jgi:hypothetical protein
LSDLSLKSEGLHIVRHLCLDVVCVEVL